MVSYAAVGSSTDVIRLRVLRPRRETVAAKQPLRPVLRAQLPGHHVPANSQSTVARESLRHQPPVTAPIDRRDQRVRAKIVQRMVMAMTLRAAAKAVAPE